MKKVTFYLIEKIFSEVKFKNHEWLACQLAVENWRIDKSILIICEDKIQAERLDKMLWENEPYQFIPHNLVRNDSYYIAPIEISWSTKENNIIKDILINLKSTFIDFIPLFNEVIDFVPIDEHLKQLARKRYKIYRNIGFNLIIAKLPTIK
ncbi:MAG: DNA polymerase III subunit chi [Arsenophonus endosymbiont of Ceratovacuna japonica]